MSTGYPPYDAPNWGIPEDFKHHAQPNQFDRMPVRFLDQIALQIMQPVQVPIFYREQVQQEVRQLEAPRVQVQAGVLKEADVQLEEEIELESERIHQVVKRTISPVNLEETQEEEQVQKVKA